ncbi:hypothetical protein CAOG_00970 [Capsaspora owczarzaki ATCC 30864]|uniref:Uncharacterized protein n=1 Tax=Capsaspora owczarzaki (strain ATCC 30864) TaxID=595528 RepID=A0A0D2X0R4_CAPO3|nr:hypothetical protein CAOG_00970 [Capsaspora owczarzaki ATCC 30864]KJE89514.1 hypothetical protein CAOG_000970 [Capsaspora owczarzaki ATCC 30864]|eukprot:XP_004365841.2 hypothetical protein CAOG_00970 [Capsaspora owczarzaki ATCC 30864]
MRNGTSGESEPSVRELFDHPTTVFLAFVGVDCAAWLLLLCVFGWSILRHCRAVAPANAAYKTAIYFVICTPMIMATLSLACLFFPEAMVVSSMVQSTYEAVALWKFYVALRCLLGDVPHMHKVLGALPPKNYYSVLIFKLCCWHHGKFVMDESHFRTLRLCVLQICIVRPVVLLGSVILWSFGLYTYGNYSMSNGYLYITIINATSLLVTMWALLVIFFATRTILADFRIGLKFTAIKLVFLLAIVQSFVLSLYNNVFGLKGNIFTTHDQVESWLNWLLVIEMFLLSLLFAKAFPASEYEHVPEPGSLSLSAQDSVNGFTRGSERTPLIVRAPKGFV